MLRPPSSGRFLHLSWQRLLRLSCHVRVSRCRSPGTLDVALHLLRQRLRLHRHHSHVGVVDMRWQLMGLRRQTRTRSRRPCVAKPSKIWMELVIYRCTNTLRLWSSLQRVEHRDLFTEVCSRLEATARDTFSLHGWQHNLRIEAPPV
nr:uncharacterized protein LOC127295499 [Lolium perenne]